MRTIISTLRQETESAQRALHALIQFKSFLMVQKTLDKVNENYYFWSIFENSVTTKLFISIRRLFDNGTDTFKFSFVCEECIRRINEFSPDAIEARKAEGHSSRPAWLDEYMIGVYKVTKQDFENLRALVSQSSKNMHGKYKDAASKIFAHAVHTDIFKIDEKLSELNLEEIEISLDSIWHFCSQISNLYENGDSPSLIVSGYPDAKKIRESVAKQLDAQS